MPAHVLPLRHFLLALAVVAIWGTNFVVIKLALGHLPPLLFGALRFTLAALPIVFFLPRPAASWRNLAAYGLLIGVGQFGLLFIAMNGRISPGLASLVIQTQVLFTIFLSMRISHEHVKPMQWVALALAMTGIGVIGAHTDGTTTIAGLALILIAAASWAGGNMVNKQAGRVNMVAYVAWSSLFAAPPLFALSLMFEGWPAISAGLQEADLGTWAAVLWQTIGNSLFGYAVWGWLLGRYPAATVTPMALLVPVFGMAASSWWLGESMPAWKFIAMALVMGDWPSIC
ncbi:MAG: EamA family transporter [Betaproteobacteria bacterium]|nr:EamA family transporter [Betaproteobacteria bacterium]